MFSNSSKRVTLEELTINPQVEPEWLSGADRLPSIGEIVLCTSGLAEVIKLHGKTGNGSRLLELRLVAEKAPPFYAAASNVLVKP